MIYQVPTPLRHEKALAAPLQRRVLPLVAVLCVAKKSVYKGIEGVEAYDPNRDVRTFAGGMPVVCHPPCRSWSAYCAHQAKPLPGEKELGPLCVKWLKECGGVLEHPAHSRLWDECGLPKPGWTANMNDLWSIEVSQAWWGDTRTKNTWLCFSKINPLFITYPFRLHESEGDRRRWQLMGKQQRSATHPSLAQWLVDAARNVGRDAREWDGENI